MGSRLEGWHHRAIVVSLAGLFFSLALSAAILVGTELGFPSMAAIKRAGIDLSMRAFVTFPWITDPPTSQSSSERYAFVDVGVDACEEFTKQATCAARESVPVPLIKDFIQATDNAGAKVIIVDVLPEETEQQIELYNTLKSEVTKRKEGAWIIAPIVSRSRVNQSSVEETADLSQLNSGRLFLASISTISDADALDGVIRHYPLLNHVKSANSPESRWIPTVPFLAAMLARPATERAVMCRFYKPGLCNDVAPGIQQDARFENYVRLGEENNLQNRIFYTFPSLVVFGTEADTNAGVYTGRYDRFSAKDLLVNGRFQIPADTLRDRIVILGSSGQQAEDRYMTPIGPMSGAEIVLNATRAIREFAAIRSYAGKRISIDLPREFWERTRAAFIGLLVFLPTWSLLFWLAARTRGGGGWTTLFRSVVSVLIFGAALILALVIEFAWSLSQLRGSVEAGIPMDMLTPVAALGLEGYAEAAQVLKQASERFAEVILNLIRRFVTWVRALL